MKVQSPRNHCWRVPTENMAAGDTVLSDHETLNVRVSCLMESTQKALNNGQYPMVVAAKWHGYNEYQHPLNDENGRTGHQLSNFILLRACNLLLIVKLEDRSAHISVLKQIRADGTEKHLITFFFKTAIARMKKIGSKAKEFHIYYILLKAFIC